MPKSRRSKNVLDSVVEVSGRALTSLTFTSGSGVSVQTLLIVPNFGGKLAALGNIYQYYRFLKYIVELHPAALVGDAMVEFADVNFGYVSQATSFPTTVAQVVELPWSRTYTPIYTSREELFELPLRKVKGQFPWYLTQVVSSPTNADNQLAIQGELYFALPQLAYTQTLTVYVRYVCEFKGLIDSGLPTSVVPTEVGLNSGSATESWADMCDEDEKKAEESADRVATNMHALSVLAAAANNPRTAPDRRVGMRLPHPGILRNGTIRVPIPPST